MKCCVRYAVILAIVFASGCGGGGGSDPFYGGVWDFVGSKVLDTCNSGVAQTESGRLTVNQDGNRVVVNSGSIVLTGSPNNSDGFDVSGPVSTGNDCIGEAAYSFKNASDGNANVGVALAVSCGSGQCTVGYSGTAARESGKVDIIVKMTLDLNVEAELLAKQCEQQAGARVAFDGNSNVKTTALNIAASLVNRD